MPPPVQLSEMTRFPEAERTSLRARLLSRFGISPKRPDAAPNGMRVYAVGDVHGCLDALLQLHANILADAEGCSATKVVVYLGDYVDRGTDSKRVVEELVGSPLPGFRSRYVKGNHEQALLDFLVNPETYRTWRSFGAPETLLSYGVKPPLFDSSEGFAAARDALADALPGSHLSFFRSLEPMVTLGDYAFVHAGVRPGLSLEDQTEKDLLWIREDFLTCDRTYEKVIVHGHTPAARPVRLHNRISLDTGVYVTGVLSCAVLEQASCRFIQSRENG